jgi:GT2 family glycosyltransferase
VTQIELLTLAPGDTAAAVHDAWDRGPRRCSSPSPAAVARELATAAAEAVLVLDHRLRLPPDTVLDRLLAGPADAWHGGLALGLAGQPRLYDHVNPLWMFNAPLDPTIEATSWRLSLRALLVRRTVLDQLGGPLGSFDTLAGSALELGLRWIRGGALVRHVPDLVPPGSPTSRAADDPPTEADGLRLIGRHHGRTWAGWALQRAVVTRELSPVAARRLVPVVRAASRDPLPHFRPPERPPGAADRTVSVILPTIDRYPYLVPLLHQLAAQTTRPHQVLIVDQTPRPRRRHDLAAVEPGLPVTVFEQDTPGQSTARNRALQAATGDFVLFIDDDDEIGPDLIADHLRSLTDGVDASSGGVDDATAGPPPEGFRHRRANDNFPTNNTMLRRSVLARSGSFDPAFDRLPMEDHDLGLRLHLAGATLLYDPAVLVYHHHAPAGGLRVHGTRTVTRAGSRRSLRQRNHPAVTELALGHRYGTARQRREARAVRTLSTLSGDGSTPRRIARLVVQLVLLPSTVRRIRVADAAAAVFPAPPGPSTAPATSDPAATP